MAKPDKQIFKIAEQSMKFDKNKVFYIGDSFQNDIVGAKKVGWKAVWSNRRNHKKPENEITYDYLINNESSLEEFVKSVI